MHLVHKSLALGLGLDMIADPALDLRQRHPRLAIDGECAGAVDDGEGSTDSGHAETKPLERTCHTVGLCRLWVGHQLLPLSGRPPGRPGSVPLLSSCAAIASRIFSTRSRAATSPCS